MTSPKHFESVLSEQPHCHIATIVIGSALIQVLIGQFDEVLSGETAGET